MGRTVKCTVFSDTPWWRDSHGRRYTGLAAAASSPVLWVMDYTPPGPDNKGVYALMTFTVGEFADGLGTYPSREEITRSVTEALAFLFDDTRALSTSEHFIELVPATWNAAESWVGGGPNMLLKPGMLSGEGCAGSALNEPWNDVVFFASAETSRKIEPSGDPVYTPGSDPTQMGTYSDHRQGLGYLDGAVISGRYVAAQVMGNTPAPRAALATAPAPLAPDEPQSLSPDQVKQVLTLLCEALHAASAIQVPAWEGLAPPWNKDPLALQAWFANTLVGALVQSGLLSPPPDPPTPEWMAELTQAAIALIGSGYRYSTRDLTEDMPEARRRKLQSIQELTQIAGALMRLRSTEPFVPEQQQQPMSYPEEAGMARAPHARFTCLSRMLGKC
jgi:monoamine oxidase